MKISLKWLGMYGVDVREYMVHPLKLSELLTNAGLEVEAIVDQGQVFQSVITGQILEKNKHPNADALTLCLVSTGESQHRIVCGAKNHNAGDKVVVALPGAVLPGDFAIKVSKIRGEESQGMLCSEKELGLSAESEGIMILPSETTVGIPFAKWAKKDDVILDIKVTPNRADCLSHFGLAREIAGITGKTYEFPIVPFSEGRDSTRKLIKITVEEGELCPRYAGRVIRNVKITASPEWIKNSLESVGLRSINNVVDITNFIMMSIGQPLHAFDLAQLDGAQINVRKSYQGEKFVTLDKQELTLEGTELVICDAKKPVALAGVMGGLQSGVTENTKDLFVESAYFLPSTVRRSSRRHGLESESSYRFSRGVDPDAINLALNKACQLIAELTGGTVCTDSYDIYPRPVVRPRIELDLKFISARLGMVIEGVEAKRLLEKIGCDISGSGARILVNPPAYRSDLKLAEDLGEEILRLKGFSFIPETLPKLSAEPTADDLFFGLEFLMAETLRSFGFNHAVNLNFTDREFEDGFLTAMRGNYKELGIDLDSKSVELQNPLNIRLAVMRRSLIPSLVNNVNHNFRHGVAAGTLFEIAPVFSVKESKDIKEQSRPFTEMTNLAMVIWGESPEAWLKTNLVPPFFKIKGVVEALLREWQFKSVKFETIKENPGFLHPGQSARIVVEGKPIGYLGVLHPGIANKFEVKTPVALAEINFKILMARQPRALRSKVLPKFPTVQRDVALLAPISVSSGEIKDTLVKIAGNLLVRCDLFDLYTGEKLPADKKSLAFRLTYQDSERTLSDDEVNALHQNAVAAVSQKLGLSLR